MGKPLVAILMGSKSDAAVMKAAADTLREFGVPCAMRVMSAHRTPEVTADFARRAATDGIKVMICAAGMAAHLAGSVAAQTTLPVIGVPMACEPFDGLDALLSTVQMPPGIPVATVSAGKAGARNAALLAVAILALADPALSRKLGEFRAAQAKKVQDDDAALQQEIGS